MTAQTTTPTAAETRDAWDAIAGRYDRFTTPENMAFAEQALERVQVGPGTRFLDVACGSGAVSIPAARRGAQVTAVDHAPTMIERLRARAQAEGLDIEAMVMDATALDLPDATFDLSASLNGVSLLPDRRAGLDEIARVTKPGGRLLLATFGALEKVEFLGFFLGALRTVVTDFKAPPMDPPPPAFQLADPSRMRQELTDVGFTDVRVQTTSWQMHFPSGRHFWEWVTASNPIAVQLTAGLTTDQRTEVQQVLDGMLREHSGGTPGAVLQNAMNIAVATLPPTSTDA